MRSLTYLGLLVGCVLVTLPLEVWLGTRVYARWRRLVTTLAIVLVIFGGWDAVAVHAGQWSYERSRVVAVLPGGLPLEELLFFVVVPICIILAFEAVRRCRPAWPFSDRPDS
jgi:lycopene cyclase domain-containing protein